MLEIRGDLMTQIHDDVIRIVEKLISHLYKGELPYRYKLAINQLKKEIQNASEAQLTMALIDLDQEIRKILYADNVDDIEDLNGK
jgi:hypothetical protein